LVAAVLIGTAASDIFTQDLEDLPQLLDVDDDPPDVKTEDNNNNIANNNTRMATERQVNYIQKLIKKKDITEEEFFEEWESYFDSWDNIPFNIVNDILEWVREQ